MKTIILISACKTKSDEKGAAKNLYKGQFTEKAYRYATKIEHDKIFFLSTGFHLVEPEQEVTKINKKFSDMKNIEKRDWAKVVLKQLTERGIDIENDELIFLTPKDYWKWIIENLRKSGKKTMNFKTPLKGLSQGKQIGWITNKLREVEKSDNAQWFGIS